MKYTGYLIKGNHSQLDVFTPQNNIGRNLWTVWSITFAIGMLCFCMMLLPLTVTTDVARSAYCLELKVMRKLTKKTIKVNSNWQSMTGFMSRVASVLF